MTNLPDDYLSSVICHPDELQASTGRLFYHINSHLPSGTYQGPIGGFLGSCVHVLNLDLNDLHDVFFRQLANLRFARLFGARRNIRGFLQQDGCRRRLGDEGKRFIFIDGDNDRQNIAGLFLSNGVKLFTNKTP